MHLVSEAVGIKGLGLEPSDTSFSDLSLRFPKVKTSRKM